MRLSLSSPPSPLAALAAVLAAAGGCRCGGDQAAATRPAGEVIAKRITGALRPPAEGGAAPTGPHPAAAAWSAAEPMVVPLQPQDLVEPRLMEPGVAQLEVRALHDGSWIAFRLEWRDATRDALIAPGRFSDAAAIQLPVDAAGDVTDPAMGLAGRPVAITLWKAAWQETADPVAALRPNMPPYHYPFEAAQAGERAALERQFAPARGANNPSTLREPGVAVQDLRAEGAGTITAVRRVSEGKGDWKDGVWRAVIARPLDPGDGSPVRPGRRTYVAFAVWDGGHGEVGAKKMRTVWVPLRVEDAR